MVFRVSDIKPTAASRQMVPFFIERIVSILNMQR